MARTGTPTWQSWYDARERCENSSNKSYADYGGRGIGLCERWQVYANFLADMGERPKGLTLERKDNNKGYEPDNCCWATQQEQAWNKRVRVDSPFKCPGVVEETTASGRLVFRAAVNVAGRFIRLYRGQDFFEACCARKSWEAKHRN